MYREGGGRGERRGRDGGSYVPRERGEKRELTGSSYVPRERGERRES